MSVAAWAVAVLLVKLYAMMLRVPPTRDHLEE